MQFMSTTTLKPTAKLRWAKWFGNVMLALLLALVVGHAWWGHSLRKRVEARLDVIRRAGEPVLPADLNAAPVPPEIDGGPDLRAAAALVDGEDWNRLMKHDLALPFTPQEREQVDAILKTRGAAFARVRSAMARPRAQLIPTFSSPVLATVLEPDLAQQRTLAYLLRISALAAHEEGNDARVVRHVREMLCISRAADSSPTLVAHLVSLSIAGLATQVAVEVMPDLHLAASGERTTDDAGPVARAEVQRLIVELLDERATTEGFRHAIRGERVSMYDAAVCIGTGASVGYSKPGVRAPAEPSWGPVRRYLAKPFIYSNAEMALRLTTAQLDAIGAPSWPAFRSTREDVAAEIGDRNPYVLIASLMAPALDRAVIAHYCGLAGRRMAAVALACRLYQLDHGGRLAASLEQLVPDYLPCVPRDPLAAGDAPLHYLANRARPIIYSVGENERDDGGVEADPKLPRKKTIGFSDEVRYLTRQPRPLAEPDDEESAGQ
jgi:hypothetical protein